MVFAGKESKGKERDGTGRKNWIKIRRRYGAICLYACGQVGKSFGKLGPDRDERGPWTERSRARGTQDASWRGSSSKRRSGEKKYSFGQPHPRESYYSDNCIAR